MPKKQWIQKTKMVYKKKNPIDRFMAKIIKVPSGCWEWRGSYRKGVGYAQFSLNGYPELGHRAAWILFFGKIPDGKRVLHSCDNVKCSNPDHLFLGDQKDNVNDMIQKERDAIIGERNHSSILKNHDIPVIFSMKKDGKTLSQISKTFKCSRSTINDVLKKRTWVHVNTDKESL